jgi:hypothetical protein
MPQTREAAMNIFRRKTPEDKQPLACLRCHILDVPDKPVEWWFLPGCGHVGGRAAVCDLCKQQIDLGNRVPGVFGCPCGAAPVLTPMSG